MQHDIMQYQAAQIAHKQIRAFDRLSRDVCKVLLCFASRLFMSMRRRMRLLCYASTCYAVRLPMPSCAMLINALLCYAMARKKKCNEMHNDATRQNIQNNGVY